MHISPCDGKLYLNKYGMINCKKCSKEWYIFDSQFKCANETNFGKTNMTKIYTAIAAVGQMDNRLLKYQNFAKNYRMNSMQKKKQLRKYIIF